MLKKYDLIIDVNLPDDVAVMHPCTNGAYVEALVNLKSCNAKLNTPEMMNSYVDSVLVGYLRGDE